MRKYLVERHERLVRAGVLIVDSCRLRRESTQLLIEAYRTRQDMDSLRDDPDSHQDRQILCDLIDQYMEQAQNLRTQANDYFQEAYALRTNHA